LNVRPDAACGRRRWGVGREAERVHLGWKTQIRVEPQQRGSRDAQVAHPRRWPRHQTQKRRVERRPHQRARFGGRSRHLEAERRRHRRESQQPGRRSAADDLRAERDRPEFTRRRFQQFRHAQGELERRRQQAARKLLRDQLARVASREEPPDGRGERAEGAERVDHGSVSDPCGTIAAGRGRGPPLVTMMESAPSALATGTKSENSAPKCTVPSGAM